MPAGWGFRGLGLKFFITVPLLPGLLCTTLLGQGLLAEFFEAADLADHAGQEQGPQFANRRSSTDVRSHKSGVLNPGPTAQTAKETLSILWASFTSCSHAPEASPISISGYRDRGQCFLSVGCGR